MQDVRLYLFYTERLREHLFIPPISDRRRHPGSTSPLCISPGRGITGQPATRCQSGRGGLHVRVSQGERPRASPACEALLVSSTTKPPLLHPCINSTASGRVPGGPMTQSGPSRGVRPACCYTPLLSPRKTPGAIIITARPLSWPRKGVSVGFGTGALHYSIRVPRSPSLLPIGQDYLPYIRFLSLFFF